MSQGAWEIIKHSKSFYVRTYRLGVKSLIISVFLNLILGLMICYVHFYQVEPDYYATSGIVPPVMLRSLSAPNNSNVPLLEPDPIETEAVKSIPTN